MKFFKKVFGLAVLVAVGGGIFGVSAASLNTEGEWSTTVKVSRGQEHTFWITGLTADSAVFSLDVSGTYKYKEDGETWEDEVWPFESCEVENASGGWDKYVLLTADDWDGVPESVKSVTFTVYASGFYDEEVKANNNFTFGHAAGRDAYPGSFDPPVPPTPVGEADNPLTFSLKTLTANDPVPGKLDVTAADEFEGPVYYIKTASLVAGQKYRFGYSGSSSISNFTMSASLTGTDDLFTTEGIGKAYPDWEACSQAFEVVPTISGVYYIRLKNVNAGDAFSFFHASLPKLTPAKHLPDDLAVGAESAKFSPGYMNDPAGYAYDEVIDQKVFRITGYDKGENLVFRTEGADSDLIMRLYDSTGKCLATNFTAGAGSKDVQLAWTTTAKYAKTSETTILYLGVCQKLADGEEPTAGPVTLAVAKATLQDAVTPVTAVPAAEKTNPCSAEGVIPSAARQLGANEWANTFALAAREKVKYTFKAKLADGGTDNGLRLQARAYTLANGRETAVKLESDAIDPDANGFLSFTVPANKNDTVYVAVSVADGSWGKGQGLTYGPYQVCVIAEGDDYGILQVPMAGAPDSMMGWKIASGPSKGSQEPFYPAGAGAIVKAGEYTYTVQTVTDYVKDNKAYTVTVKKGVEPSVAELYKYRDAIDPLDDDPDKNKVWSGTTKYKPTELRPTATKPVEFARSLWKDDGARYCDTYDWFTLSATEGNFYRFDLVDPKGCQRIDVFGPDNVTTNAGNLVPTVLKHNPYLCEQIRAVAGTYYVRVMRDESLMSTNDNSYVLRASTAAPGQIKLTKTEYSVNEGTAYVDVGVSRTGKDGMVRVMYRTEADTAKPGKEYYPVNGTNVWLNGDQKEQKIRINLIPEIVSRWTTTNKFFNVRFEVFDEAKEGPEAFADDEYIPSFTTTTKTTGSGANRVTTVTTNDTVKIIIKPTAKKTPGTIQLAGAADPKKPVVTIIAGETEEIALERVLGTNGLVGVAVVSAKGTANKNGETDFVPINTKITWEDGEGGRSPVIPIVTKKTDGDFTGTKSFTLKLTKLSQKVDNKEIYDTPTLASQSITVNIVNDKYEQNVTDYAKTLPKTEGVGMKEGKKDSWFREVGDQGEEFYSVVSRTFKGPSRLWWGPTWDPFRTNMFVSAKGETVTMRSEDVYTNDLLQAATPAAPTLDMAVVSTGIVELCFNHATDEVTRGISNRVYLLSAGACWTNTAKRTVNYKLGDPETEVLADTNGNYVANVAYTTTNKGKYTWRVDTFFKGGTVTNTAVQNGWSFTVLNPAETAGALVVDGLADGVTENLNLGVPVEYAIHTYDDAKAKVAVVSGTGSLPGSKLKLEQNTTTKKWFLRGYADKAGDFQCAIQATSSSPTLKSPTYVLKFHVAALPDNKTIVALAPTVDKAVLTAGAHNLKFEAGDNYRVFFGKDADKSKFGKDPAFEIADPYPVQVEAGVKYAWQVFTFAEGGSVTNGSVTFALTGAPTGTLNTAGYETKITGKDAYNADYAEGTVMRLRQRLDVDFQIDNDYAPAKDVEIKSVTVLAGRLPDGLKPPAANNQWRITGAPTKAGTYQAVIQTTYMEVLDRDLNTGKPRAGQTKDFAAATKVMDFVVEEVTAPADLSFTLAGPGRLVYTATDARIPLGRDDRTETKTNFISKTSETLKLSDVERLHSYEYVKLDAVTPMAPTVDKAAVADGSTEFCFYHLPDDKANGIDYRVYVLSDGASWTNKTTDARGNVQQKTGKFKLGDPETEVQPDANGQYFTNVAYTAVNRGKYTWRVDSYFKGGPVTNTVKTAWTLTALGKDAPSTHISGRDAWGYQVDNGIYDQTQIINLYQGVKAEFSVDLDGEIANLASVKLVSGKLPDGVKIATAKPQKGTAKWAFLSGTPTKAGDFEALLQLSYSDTAKTTATTALMRFHVRAAGSSIGTFNGLATSYDSTNLVHRLAQVQFTSAAGNLSSKVTIAGKSYTFADKGFVRITGGNPEDETVPATLQAELSYVQKVKEPKWNAQQGKYVDTDVSYTNVLTFTVTDAPVTDSTVWATNSMAELTVQMEALPDLKGTHGQYGIWYEGKAYRNNSAVKEWAAAAAPFAGYYTVALVPADADQSGNVPCGNGYMTLKLDAKGGAQMAGALADGTTYSASTKAAFDLVGDEIAVRIPLYAYKTATAGGNVFGGWFTIRYPKGCAPTTNLAETPVDAVPVAVCEIGDSTMAWLNEDPNSTYYGYEGFDLTLYPVGGWYDTVINLQRYYRSADFPYNEFSVDTAAGNDLWMLQELLTENSKSQYDDDPDYKFVAEASANGQAVDVVGNDISVVKQTLVKKIDPETGRAGKYNDWSNSVNSANVKLTFKRATGIMTGTCDLWYAGNKVINAAGDTTYEEKSFANCKHAGVLLLSRDPAQNWLGDTDEACTWTAGSVVIPQSIPLGNNKTRKWNASFRFNIKATKVNRSWGEQPPYSGK